MPSSVRCVPTSGIAISAGTNVPRREPTVGKRVEAAGHCACRCDVGDREPDRERRDHPEQDDGGREQEQDGEEGADHGARGRVVEAAHRRVEERPGDEGRQGHPCRRGEHDQAKQAWLRPPIGELAAEEVAERERGEDDPDQVRPDDRRGAEVRGQQPGGGDLGCQRADPGPEDECGERRLRAPHPDRLITTSAKSSASSPASVQSRQAASAVVASCLEGRPRCSESNASRRSGPNCSPPRRASTTPSV